MRITISAVFDDLALEISNRVIINRTVETGPKK